METVHARSERWSPAWIAIGVAGAIAFFVASVLQVRAISLPSKAVPIIALLAMVRWRGADRYDRWIAAGLVASLIGDVFEEAPGDHFIAGLLAFLIAHVFYIVAFSTPTPTSRIPLAPLRLVPFAFVAGIVMAVLAPRLGALLVPVVIYMGTIVVMAWRAAARVGVAGESTRAQWAGVLGAVCFLVSDGILAVNKFHHHLHGELFFVMITYWAAQIGITVSTRRTPDGEVSV
jgi:uncharacterized membrane protein YhhN